MGPTAKKGTTSALLSGVFVGVSYWADLFYRLTVLADPRWPDSVQKTAFLFSLLVAIGVSIACARYNSKRLVRIFVRTLATAIGLLVISFFLYLAMEAPFV